MIETTVEAPKKMGRPKKVDSIDTLVTDVKALITRVDALLEKRETPPEVITPSPAPVPEPVAKAVTKTETQFPIPLEFREVVETILNKLFEIDIKYLSDQAAFEFYVRVPKKYSNAGDKHWEMFGEDCRSKVIINAYGAAGVREFIMQIYNNFTDEARSAISYDRSQLL